MLSAAAIAAINGTFFAVFQSLRFCQADPAMINLKNLELWFVPGSQHLYGPEVLARVQEHANTIAAALSESSSIPVRVIPKPVMTSSESVQQLCHAPTGVVLLFAQMLTRMGQHMTISQPLTAQHAAMLISGREPVASPGSEGRQSTCEREKKRFVVQCDLQALLFYITAVRDLPDDGHIELGIVFLDVADSVLSAEFRDHGRHL